MNKSKIIALIIGIGLLIVAIFVGVGLRKSNTPVAQSMPQEMPQPAKVTGGDGAVSHDTNQKPAIEPSPEVKDIISEVRKSLKLDEGYMLPDYELEAKIDDDLRKESLDFIVKTLSEAPDYDSKGDAVILLIYMSQFHAEEVGEAATQILHNLDSKNDASLQSKPIYKMLQTMQTPSTGSGEGQP